MTFEFGLTLGIIVMALVLFATEKLRVDLIALIVLLLVSITGLVPKEEVFSGFANPAVITIWAVYIVSGGLFKTGVADMLGLFILRLSGTGEARLIAVIMLVCGIMSAFMNNVGAVAVLMPAVIGISKEAYFIIQHTITGPKTHPSVRGCLPTPVGGDQDKKAVSCGSIQFTKLCSSHTRRQARREVPRRCPGKPPPASHADSAPQRRQLPFNAAQGFRRETRSDHQRGAMAAFPGSTHQPVGDS
ncbi:MAG: SLC13 family permease [Anaerolineales bacterium]|jgi:hypothetical protein